MIGVILSGTGCLFICLMLFRNSWVFERRSELLGTSDYEKLPSYNYMYYRFWIWDVEKFINDK
jgi:hypothetical protein